MSKRRVVWILLLAILVSLAAGAWLLPTREPVYQGRKLSEWLAGVGNHDQGGDDTNAVFAVREIGTNAIPWLLNELGARDSWLKRRLTALAAGQNFIKISSRTEDDRLTAAMTGFQVLGPQARMAMPALMKRLRQPDSAEGAAFVLVVMIQNAPTNERFDGAFEARRGLDALDAMRRDVLAAGLSVFTNHDLTLKFAGVWVLAEGAVDAASAVRALIQGLHDPDLRVRQLSARGLGRKTSQPVAAIPPLIAALGDAHFVVRRQAAESLGSYYRQAKTAVPALLQARADPHSAVRAAVKVALDKIDPETAATIPDLPDFKPLPPAPSPSPSAQGPP